MRISSRLAHTGRTAAFAAAVLVAAALPLAVAPAAQAEEGCLSEAYAFPNPTRCDDSTTPETTITKVSPGLREGWLPSTSVRIEFEGRHTDADADPLRFECQFFQSVAAPSSWSPCTSPMTYDDLLQNQATPYTFRVRAVDSADALQNVANPLIGRVDTADLDPTPDSVAFTADATPPNTFGYLRTTWADESGRAPMLVSRTVDLRLQSAEGSAYRCRLDSRATPCAEGLVTLRDLSSGRHRFVAAAVDPAGNVDPSPYVQEMFVPRNLTRADAVRASRGDWTQHRQPGMFGNDYLESRTYGAMLTVPVRNVREIRLIAPADPDFGRVEIRVGNGRWFPVSLRGPERTKVVVHEVRGDRTSLVGGRLQIRVASHDSVVRVDAISTR